MQSRLERVGATFLSGYHLALEHGTPNGLATELNLVEPDWRGFAFEGAAMGLALLDRLTPWRADRISQFLHGAGDAHAYMVHVAVGWVWARWPFGFRKAAQHLDPLLRWLAFDGWGFHEGFFHWPKYIDGQARPKRLADYEVRAFDQGLGRSWWFVNGGNPELIARTMENFPTERRGDLWSGLGLASVYAGQISEAELHSLRAAAGNFLPQLAQGAAFAAKARHRAGNPTPYTDRACWILCGQASADAAAVTDAALENLPANGAEPAYEIWRRRIQEKFSQGKELKR